MGAEARGSPIAIISDLIEETYGIAVDQIEEIPYGFSNQEYLIRSKGNRYVARISSLNKIEHLQFELYVLNQLQNYDLGFNVPRVVKTTSETDFINLDDMGMIITLFYFIPGKHAFKFWTYPFRLKGFSGDLGKKIGTLHSALSKLDDQQTRNEHTLEQLVQIYLKTYESYQSLVQSLPRVPAWLGVFIDEIDLIIDETIRYLDYFRRFQHLKEIVHTDLRLENMLVCDGKITAILDFDDILIGDQAYDLAKILVEIYSNKRCMPNKVEDLLDVEGFMTFVQQYEKTSFCDEKLHKAVDLINLPALHVLSIVGRDPDFDDNERKRNVFWYSNFIRVMRNRKNATWLKSKLGD